MSSIKSIILPLLTLGLLQTASANSDKTESESFKGRVLIGIEGGISEPAAKGFTHKLSNTRVTLKKSALYGINLGYEFDPNMYLNFSAAIEPHFKVGIKLPDNMGSMKTKADGRIYMLSLMYDLMDIKGVTPYIILGAGLGQIKVKEGSVNIDHPLVGNMPIFKTIRKTSNSFAWQVGIGLSKYITGNVKLSACAKLLVIKNVKVPYESLNQQTFKMERKGMKQTLGTGDFAIGLSFLI